MRESGHRVIHQHVEVVAPRAEAHGCLVRSYGGDDGSGDFQVEAAAILDGAAPGVCSAIAGILKELIGQIAVAAALVLEGHL